MNVHTNLDLTLGKSRSRGVRGRKVRISPGEVKKLGRRRKKSKNKPRGNQEASVQKEEK